MATVDPFAPGFISAKLDQRSYDRAMARLAKYEGAPFKERMTRAYEAGGRLTVSPMRRAAPKDTGELAARVSMRKGRPDAGYIIRVGTKSRAPHAGLVSKGHRIVTKSGVDTGRLARSDPFVSEVIARYESRVVSFITKAVGKESSIRSLG